MRKYNRRAGKFTIVSTGIQGLYLQSLESSLVGDVTQVNQDTNTVHLFDKFFPEWSRVSGDSLWTPYDRPPHFSGGVDQMPPESAKALLHECVRVMYRTPS